jgi:hypothetical protein
MSQPANGAGEFRHSRKSGCIGGSDGLRDFGGMVGIVSNSVLRRNGFCRRVSNIKRGEADQNNVNEFLVLRIFEQCA